MPSNSLGFRLQIEAQTLKVLVPVRVLDHHLHFRIDRFRRLDDECARGFIQKIEPESSPALGSFGADAVFALAVGEEKIVENDFVEQPGRELHDFLEASSGAPDWNSSRSGTGSSR